MATTPTTEQTDLDRIHRAMDIAIERHEHAREVAETSGDPFWEEMARLSGIAAERAVKAYEEAGEE